MVKLWKFVLAQSKTVYLDYLLKWETLYNKKTVQRKALLCLFIIISTIAVTRSQS